MRGVRGLREWHICVEDFVCKVKSSLASYNVS